MANGHAPPGLDKTLDSRLDVILDWIEFTVHNYTLSDTIIHLLELKEDSFTKIPDGKNSYTNQKIWNEGNIFIIYNNKTENDRMDIHIIINGKGCRLNNQKKNHHKM